MDDHAEQHEDSLNEDSLSPLDEDPWGMMILLVAVTGAASWIALAFFTPG